MGDLESVVDKIRSLQGTLPRPAIWVIGRYDHLKPDQRLRGMKLVSKGVATATQFGDGVFIDSGIDWCAGDVKFPPEIRTAFPLIGVSNSLAKFQPRKVALGP